MKRRTLRTALRGFAAVIVAALAWTGQAQEAKTPYPKMAPVDQYMMDRNAEIALARSAAPESISGDAEVMVLGRHGYEVAVKGKNGFVCIVDRSWATHPDDPQFWNPKMRGPTCFNPPAARYNIPIELKKAELILAGKTPAQMAEEITAAFDKKEFPALEPGAMAYMMSKQGYLNDTDGHWHPHLMFFLPPSDPATWGVGSAGAPIYADKDTLDRYTLYFVPIPKWSDGTPYSMDDH